MPQHLRDISEILMKKFKGSYYLHFMFFMVLIEYCCEKGGGSKYVKIGLQLLLLCKTIKTKLKKVLNFDNLYFKSL